MWWSQGCGTVIQIATRVHKYCCFLCEWSTWGKRNRYVNKLWPKRTSLMPGKKYVSLSLVLLEKIFLPPLHIKLGHVKTLWKVRIKLVMDWNMWGIISQMWVTQKSKRVYIYIYIYIGLQIRELIQDKQFNEDMTETERNAWL